MAEDEITQADMNLRNLIACEPKKVDHFEFLLTKSFEKARQEGDDAIWKAMPIRFYGNYLVGSVVFENIEQNLLNLSFFISEITTNSEDKALAAAVDNNKHYPQNPTQQEWAVSYPILAYKSFTPDDEELVIINMATEMPHRHISLQGWEFICFVEHAER